MFNGDYFEGKVAKHRKKWALQFSGVRVHILLYVQEVVTHFI